jgi:hypothetical protein
MNDDPENEKLDPAIEEIPQIYNISFETGKKSFSRRKFIEAAAVTSAAVTLTSCTPVMAILSPATATPTPTVTPTPTATSTVTPTATATATFTPTPKVVTATTLNQGSNFRTGPGTNYLVIGSLAINVPLKIIARLGDGSWYKARVNIDALPKVRDRSIQEVEGWIRQDQVTLKGQSVDDLPVEAPPPTSTPLPNTPIPPGGEGIQYEYTDPYGNVKTFTLACGAPIPAGAICTCNCVTVCSCVGYVAPVVPPSCSCDSQGSETICTCDMVSYWYPN